MKIRHYQTQSNPKSRHTEKRALRSENCEPIILLTIILYQQSLSINRACFVLVFKLRLVNN